MDERSLDSYELDNSSVVAPRRVTEEHRKTGFLHMGVSINGGSILGSSREGIFCLGFLFGVSNKTALIPRGLVQAITMRATWGSCKDCV